MTNQTQTHYPFDLPNATAVNGQRPNNRVLATEAENEVRNVRGYTRDPGMSCEVTWVYDQYQVANFFSWWKYTLKNGVKWFWIRLPTSDGLDAWQLARFASKFQMEPSGIQSATVRATLEVRDRFLIQSRPYTVPAPFNYPLVSPGTGDPLWDDVRFAADFSTNWGMKDVKHNTTPSAEGTVALATGTSPAKYGYVHGNEAFLDYGVDGDYTLTDQPAWCAECKFCNLGGEKDSVIWSIQQIYGEPFSDVYAQSFGFGVRRGTFYFFCRDFSNGNLVEIAVVHSVVLPQSGWYHAVVQERNGMLEVGVTRLGNDTGELTIVAPSLFTLSAGAQLFIGADGGAYDYFGRKYFTGGIDDMRITAAIRYP